MRCFILLMTLFASSMLTGRARSDNKPANLGKKKGDSATKNPAAGSRELKGHTNAIRCVAISPDGRWLVTGSFDKTARLWDLKSKNPAVGSRVLKGHTKRIYCLAISPDGRWLVTGSRDKTVRLWDLKSVTNSR